ncbi:MAG: response regulator transcription factor [Parahaliea sp.]
MCKTGPEAVTERGGDIETQVLTVALLEDEQLQAKQMMSWLEAAGHVVYWGSNHPDFITLIATQKPDVLVLDWQLPDCEGIDVLQEIRGAMGFDGPVLFATAKNSEEDIVRGLTEGADDYLVKPLRQAEFMARLLAVTRRVRVTGNDADEIRLGNLVIDIRNKRVEMEGDEVQLTPTEYRLAKCLFSHIDELLSRDYLLETVWNVTADIDTRTVDLHMSRIRKKLKIGPTMGYNLRTVYRHGYRLEKVCP